MKPFLFFFLLSVSIQAQIDPAAYGYYRDALRYSYLLPAGSARIQALGGAGVAVGGDLSSVLLNPAGLGYYNSSEASGSMVFAMNAAQTQFLNNKSTATRPHLHLPNFGVVFGTDFDAENNDNPFLSGSIAITGHRINDFQHNILASGINSFKAKDDLGRPYGNGIIDYFLQQANGTPRSVFDGQSGQEYDVLALAYAIYLINPLSVAGNERRYSSFVSPEPFKQTDSRLTKGSQYQYNLSGGANIADQFYFGAGLGITSLYYENNQKYREEVISPNELLNLELNETFSQSGVGFNANAGFIWRLSRAFRLGASIQSPTLYRISDSYNATLRVNFNDFLFKPSDYIDGDSEVPIRLRNQQISLIEPVVSNYTLVTPAKLAIGAACFLGKKGFISFDAERVNYGTARLSDPDIAALDFSADNRVVSALYRSVWNLRAGAELRRNTMRLRAGCAYYAPSIVNSTDSRIMFTSGVGYRKDEWGFDVLLAWEKWQTTFSPYTLDNGTNPIANALSTRFRLGFGVSYFFE